MENKNRLCCGLITLGTGTIIIAVIYTIFNIAEIAVTAATIDPQRKIYKNIVIWGEPVTKTQLILFLVICSIQAVLGVLLGFGAKQERTGMVLPWLIVETMVAVIATVICIAVVGKANIVLGVGFVFYVLVNAYFMLVVYKFYKALRRKRKMLDGRQCSDVM